MAAIPDDPALAIFALNRGVPFILSHPNSILARDVDRLVTRVFNLALATPARAKPAENKKKSLLPFLSR